MKPLREQAEEWIDVHHDEIAEMETEDIAREAFMAGAEVSIEQLEQWEEVRMNAAKVMEIILDGNIYQAKRKARWWLTLYQCSGPTPSSVDEL